MRAARVITLDVAAAVVVAVFVAVVVAVGPAACAGPPAQTKAGRPNASIERMRAGVLVCHAMKTGEDCGSDRWTLTIQPDGTRTQRSFVNLTRDGSQLNLIYRATADFRFLEAFEHVWNRGKEIGSGFYVIDGAALHVTTRSSAGWQSEDVPLPARFSVLLHPVSVDGWHFAQYDDARGGPQDVTIFAFGRSGTPQLVRSEFRLEFLGVETIKVPAGTFETRHYKLSPTADVWISGPDRIMVRHEFTTLDTRFELAELD